MIDSIKEHTGVDITGKDEERTLLKFVNRLVFK